MSLVKNKPVGFSVFFFVIALVFLFTGSYLARIISGGDHSITLPIVKGLLICLSILYLIVVILAWKSLNETGKTLSLVFTLLFTSFSARLFFHLNSHQFITVALPDEKLSVHKEHVSELTDSNCTNMVAPKKKHPKPTIGKKRKVFEPEMVYVEGGTFRMGNVENASDYYEMPVYDEKPVHCVAIDDFYIGKYEVTQAQWKAVIGNNPSEYAGDSLPVINVTWNDCQLFLEKLNQLTGKKYRLPTEAQWEFAARGGIMSKGYTYSGSNDISLVGWYDGNFCGNIHPVGSKTANELGIFDMNGNVSEWCNDWYSKNYYSNSPSLNPDGPVTGTYRVIRGGSFMDKAFFCRSATRSGEDPGNSTFFLGLRLVLLVD